MKITNTSINTGLRTGTTTSAQKKDIIVSFSTVGSGSIVKHKKNVTFILTAAHVCNIVYSQQISSIFPFYKQGTHELTFSRISMVYDVEGKSHMAMPLIWNPKYDVCILVTKKIDQPEINFSFQPPLYGQKIYYLGFPRGIGGGQFVPLFDGYYLGTRKMGDWTNRAKSAGYSIPIAPGSSGSAVIDKRGNLVGMLHSYYSRFDNIGLSATHNQLKELFKKAEVTWIERRAEIIKELNPSN